MLDERGLKLLAYFIVTYTADKVVMPFSTISMLNISVINQKEKAFRLRFIFIKIFERILLKKDDTQSNKTSSIFRVAYIWIQM